MLKRFGIGQFAAKFRMYTVYKITNRVNGKCYIGITSRTAEIRWEEHLSRARCGVRNSRLYDAVRKYGEDSFDLQALATADTEDKVRALERFHILAAGSYDNGYNCNLGGAGFLFFPAHIREKISAAQKGKIIPVEARRKMSLAKIGDSRCATNFGEHTEKGAKNPKSRTYLIRFPDGSEHVVTGIRGFCRENGLQHAKLGSRGRTKGYSILKRFNDHPARE